MTPEVWTIFTITLVALVARCFEGKMDNSFISNICYTCVVLIALVALYEASRETLIQHLHSGPWAAVFLATVLFGYNTYQKDERISSPSPNLIVESSDQL